MSAVRVTAVVVAFGEEPLLEDCTKALVGEVDELIVVDNGCSSPALARITEDPGVVVLRPGHNTGFAGGANLAARHATGDVLVFVNSDAVVQPGGVAALARTATEPGVGIATASVRLMHAPALLNTAGNPVHITGLSWAGAFGEPASRHSLPGEVAAASGCAMAVRRDVWNHLGGFCEEMFAYCEDTDLSLRCWQAGLSVRYVPEAVVLHAYDFARNPAKMYLLERNRLLMVLTVFEGRTLARLALPLLAFEVGVTALAVRQGWVREKARGWAWLLRHIRFVRARRAQVRSRRSTGDAAVLPLLTSSIRPGRETGVAPPPRVVDNAFRLYWALAFRPPGPGGSMPDPIEDTRDAAYAFRLVRKQGALWKRLLRVQAIYQWNLRRQRLGRTLDIGCGIGRNLASLPPGSLGVDHNSDAVAVARARGLPALTVDEFLTSAEARVESFDSLLLAHVVEHVPEAEAPTLLRSYLPYLRPGGTVLFICPQERGFASDPTHVAWTTGAHLSSLADEVGLTTESIRSFPLPRFAGRIFTYNEFVVRARKPDVPTGLG